MSTTTQGATVELRRKVDRVTYGRFVGECRGRGIRVDEALVEAMRDWLASTDAPAMGSEPSRRKPASRARKSRA